MSGARLMSRALPFAFADVFPSMQETVSPDSLGLQQQPTQFRIHLAVPSNVFDGFSEKTKEEIFVDILFDTPISLDFVKQNTWLWRRNGVWRLKEEAKATGGKCKVLH